MTLAYALTKTGHPNCRRPDKVIDARHMADKELKTWEKSRDIGTELLQSVNEMKAGKAARSQRVTLSPVAEARLKTGMSQAVFARIMGVSKRTLQEWEQGRRKPSGAAHTLLKIASTRPEVLRELQA